MQNHYYWRKCEAPLIVLQPAQNAGWKMETYYTENIYNYKFKKRFQRFAILFFIPCISTSVGYSTDGGQLFYPAIWPAPFCHEGSTSKQPRQGAQECGESASGSLYQYFKGCDLAFKPDTDETLGLVPVSVNFRVSVSVPVSV